MFFVFYARQNSSTLNKHSQYIFIVVTTSFKLLASLVIELLALNISCCEYYDFNYNFYIISEQNTKMYTPLPAIFITITTNCYVTFAFNTTLQNMDY